MLFASSSSYLWRIGWATARWVLLPDSLTLSKCFLFVCPPRTPLLLLLPLFPSCLVLLLLPPFYLAPSPWQSFDSLCSFPCVLHLTLNCLILIETIPSPRRRRRSRLKLKPQLGGTQRIHSIHRWHSPALRYGAVVEQQSGQLVAIESRARHSVSVHAHKWVALEGACACEWKSNEVLVSVSVSVSNSNSFSNCNLISIAFSFGLPGGPRRR